MTTKKKLALLHTVAGLTTTFQQLCAELIPDVEIYHIVDESLLKNTIREGSPSASTYRCLASYLHGAEEAGADAILVTCSSVGPCVEAARPMIGIPVIRVDEPMAEKAVQTGTRIGVAATLATTLKPTMELIEKKARQTGEKHTITSMLCEGAFEAVVSGDTATHDRIVGQCLHELDAKTDVIVLAQASMARVVDAMKPGEIHVPVLSSPRLGVQYMRQVLERPRKMVEEKPTDILEDEHHVIQKVVGTFAIFAEELEAGREVKLETLRGILEFMRTFADRCHHGKEETHLFPLLERRGVPVRGCPMGALIGEHQRGRMLVTGLAAATETYAKEGATAAGPVLDSLRGLMDLYPSHIWKEDYLLFPLTNKILTAEEQNELRERFEAVEKTIGADVHHRFEKLAEKLDKETHRS